MKDSITEFELEIEFSKAANIVQMWATTSNFTVHEKTSSKILYRRDFRFGTACWVSIGYLGQKIKLSAWIAPKGLAPDQEGSFWRGNKRPVPISFATGPIGQFKKLFAKLLEMLNSESNDPSISLAIKGSNQLAFSKEGFAKGLIVLSVIVFLNGALNLYTGSHSMTNELFPELAKSFLEKGSIDVGIGVVLFFCSRLLMKGKALSIWLYGATVLFSVGYDLAIGANFPFFTMLFGIWIVNQLITLKKQGQLV